MFITIRTGLVIGALTSALTVAQSAYGACPAPAKVVVDRCSSRGPSDLQALQSRAISCVGAQEYGRAIATFTEALRAGCTVATCMANRGRAKISLGDIDGALADFGEIARSGAKPPNRYMAIAFYKKKDFDRAIAAADDALRGSSDDAEALYLRGLAKAGKGDPSGGRVDQEAAQSMDARSKFPAGNLQQLFECTHRI